MPLENVRQEVFEVLQWHWGTRRDFTMSRVSIVSLGYDFKLWWQFADWMAFGDWSW